MSASHPFSEPRPAHTGARDYPRRIGRFKFGAGVALALLLCGSSAQALTFAEAAKKGKATISELDQLKSFVAKSGLKSLGKLSVSNIKAQGQTITGDVRLMNLDWNFIASSGKTLTDTFVGFGPKKIFKFKELFRNAKGADLLDVMKFNDQMLLVAVDNVEIESAKLDANARTMLGKFYENSQSFTFQAAGGVSMFGALDMANSKPLADAVKFLGGKSTKIQVKGMFAPNAIDALIAGQPPAPSVHLEAAMPTFRPRIGGLISFPANVQFTYRADLEKDAVGIGFDGQTDFKIGKQTVNFSIANTLKSEVGKAPSMAVDMTLFKGVPWKQAFGVKWLTIEDYKMSFAVDGTGKLSVGMDGTTSFGNKSIGLGASGQIQAASAGLPLPESLRFEVNDGPNKVGELSLRDMISVLNEMGKAAGGKTLVPLDSVPEVAIAGVAVGQGPKIEMNLSADGDAGFDISGKLRILGTDIATVDKAFLNLQEGIEIRAKTAKLAAGPLGMPNATVDVMVRLDRAGGTIPTPRVLFTSESASLFGAKSSIDMAMYMTSGSLKTKQHFGDLFKFDFAAYAGLKGIDRFEDLAKADYRLMASLQSDPAKWLRDSGAKGVKQAFAGIQKGLEAATKEIVKAQAEVDKLDREINRQREIVTKDRSSATNGLKAAEEQVAKLQKDISAIDGRIGRLKGKIKSCNQNINVCYAWKLSGGGCRKKQWGICYSWEPIKSTCSASKSIPDPAARGVCEAANTGPRAEIAWAETEKGTLIASKATATATLEAIRKGLNAIPVDMDPRVAGVIAAKETAKLALEAAKKAVQGVEGLSVAAIGEILSKGVAAVGKADVFALEKSSIQGSLQEGFKGKPVVLDMNYRMFGKPYRTRLGFSLTDMAFNAKQFEVIALAAATKTVISVGKSMKIIPNALLDAVNGEYLKRQAEVDAVLRTAIAANGEIKEDPQLAQLSVGADIDLDSRVRSVKAQAAIKTTGALNIKMAGIMTDLRTKQIAAALAAKAAAPAKLTGRFALKVKTSGKCFDMTGNTAKGVRQHAWDCNPANANQIFTAEYIDGDWFRIKSARSNRCVDISGANKSDRAPVIQWDCHTGDNQKWRLVKRADGRSSLMVKHSGKCLDLEGGKRDNGAPFIQWTCGATNSNQLFEIIAVK